MRPFLRKLPAYGVAVLMTALMAYVRHALSPILGESAIFIPFVIPIIFAGAVGGMGPGLLATLLGALTILQFFIPPIHSLSVTRPSQGVGLSIYVLCGVTISIAAGALRASRARIQRKHAEVEAALGERDEAVARGTAAAEALRAAELQLRSITDAVPALVSYIDRDRRYRLVNQTYETWLGVPRDEIVGRPVREVLGETAWKVVGPKMEAAFAGEHVHYEAHVEYKNGTRWIDASYVPHRDATGSIVGIVVMVSDATGRKEREREVQIVTRRLQMVTDLMSAPVTSCGRDLRYRWVSRPYADWIGRAPEEIVGRRIEEILGREALEEIRPHVERVLNGEKVTFEAQAPFRGLGPRWIHAVYTPTRDEAGRVDGWIAVVLDIHERKEVETSLQLADRKKDEFLATLAHELRNPLAPIRHAVEILRSQSPADAEVAWARDIIDRQAAHMARLLDDLLDTSRVSHGKLKLWLKPMDLGSAIEEAVEGTRVTIEKRGQQLSVGLTRDPLPVLADRTRLVQIFMNLLSNAAKYTPAEGAIFVSARREESFIVADVRDTGIGIDADHLPHLFEMFSQPAPALERSETGLGIGLALVRALVEMHGGSISATSEGRDQGSTFTVRFPLAQAAVVEPEPAVRSDGADHPVRGRKVLIVDDLKDSADSLELLLRSAGHETWTAYDGTSAIEMAGRIRPDVVLLDVGLPGMNGYEVCRRIRAESWGRTMKIVAVTGWGTEEDRRQGAEAGFDRHLVKPIDPAVVRQLLIETPSENPA
ncbi:MAG TPA: PAS domain-containing protein [Candidatus Eisenbacteria bacterium]|nr:PAS domain-containing protein [Candidatus Eisenbacteria bacterium]